MGNRGLWLVLVLLLGGSLALWLLRAPPPPPPPSGPPAEVLAALARGVNIADWLQHGPPDGIAHALDVTDWRRIRSLRFTHVRLLVDPAAILDARGLPRPDALGLLRGAIDGARDQRLMVVLAVQLPPESKALLGDPVQREALAGFWRMLALALRDIPPRHLVLEPLNETAMEAPAASRALLAQLAGVLRAELPGHTLVVSGHRYSAIAELTQLQPLEDRNVVYGFHFYEPHNFTHQGAHWGAEAWRWLRNLPYPSSPERVAPLLLATRNEVKDLVRWHGEERWDAAKISGQVDLAARWGAQHGVPVWCSEFGVLRKHVNLDDRRAWLRDVRTALEKHRIPWTHWSYTGDFGVVQGALGERAIDPGTVDALGLAAVQ